LFNSKTQLLPKRRTSSFSGELSCKERSDAAGHFVGKWAGSARTVAQKERSDAAATAKAQRPSRPQIKQAARRRP
jgi:hypothetical protein